MRQNFQEVLDQDKTPDEQDHEEYGEELQVFIQQTFDWGSEVKNASGNHHESGGAAYR